MNRHLSLLVPLLLLLMPIEGYAKSIPVILKKATLYDNARPSLLRNGWKPVGLKMRQDGSCDPQYDDRCKTYPEARECSGSGMAYCNMVWKHRDGTLIVITTAGDGKAMIVNVTKE